MNLKKINIPITGLMIIAVVFMFLFWRENKLLLKERNYARELVVEQSKNLALIDTLLCTNEAIERERKLLAIQRKEILKNYEELKYYNDELIVRLKSITHVTYHNHDNVKALLSDLERHRYYIFLTDKINEQ